MVLPKTSLGTMVFFLLATVQSSQNQNSPSEFHVKAAYMFLFGKYITWPEDLPPDFTIGVYGPDPFGPILEEVLAGKHMRKRPFAIKRFSDKDDVKGCQILYIAQGTPIEKKDLDLWNRGGILTIGETPKFLEKGGAISFILNENRVHFSVNLRAIQSLKLKPSSQLLKIAHKVVK